MKESFHYWQCGLDYVYLIDGVERVENEYGSFYNIKNVDKVHGILAHEIITSPRPLRGQELRFLRSYLSMSQTCLATQMGKTRDAIAKWEAQPVEKLPGSMDRLLRFIYLSHKQDPDAFSAMKALLDDIAEDEYQREIWLKHKGSEWGINNKAA